MNQTLDQELCKKYPKIFRNRYADMRTTAMCWGFEHGDGWYNIINQLCGNIQHHIDWTRERRASALRYNRALDRAFKGDKTGLLLFFTFNRENRTNRKFSTYAYETVEQEVSKPEPEYRKVPEACPQVVADQIKEKFGTLRFYYHGGDEVIDGMVRMAESMSGVTCETCGSPGKIRHDGWVRTLCDTHATEAGYSLEEDDENQTSE